MLADVLLSNLFENRVKSIKEHVRMFWLKNQRRSEPDWHVAAASSLKAPVSEHPYDLVPCSLVKTVHGTESPRTASTVDQIWIDPLQNKNMNWWQFLFPTTSLCKKFILLTF